MALLIIPVLKGDRKLAVRTATYGPGIHQSQHVESVSHIIIQHMERLFYVFQQQPVLHFSILFYTCLNYFLDNIIFFIYVL